MKSKFLAFFLAGSTVLSAQNIKLNSEVPLGLAYDGKFIWVTDAKNRVLSGYDLNDKKYTRVRSLRLPGVRDIAFWREYLVSVYPRYIWLINPINGDLVEKIQVSILHDPVSIAIDGNLAYIFDRKTERFYRYDLVKKEFFGSFRPAFDRVRGATFYKGSLWAIDKNQRANKLDPATGEVLSFVPLPEKSYGVQFIKGNLYVSQPGQVLAIDYIESDYYVAASRKNYILEGTMLFNFVWNDKQRKNETRFESSVMGIPFNPHQRHRRFRAKPRIRLKRRHAGESLIAHKFAPTDEASSFDFSVNLTTFNLTHIFNKKSIKAYYDSSGSPNHTMVYLGTEQFGQNLKQQSKKMADQWQQKQLGTHPYQMIAWLKKENTSLKLSQLFLRDQGVPARETVFYQISRKAPVSVLQAFIRPVGWVSITDGYSPRRPKEFPVSNDLIELYYPQSTKQRPAAAGAKAGAAAQAFMLKVRSVKIDR